MNADATPWEITCREVKDQLDSGHDLFLLDCREQVEFDLVNLSQATLIPMSELAATVSVAASPYPPGSA